MLNTNQEQLIEMLLQGVSSTPIFTQSASAAKGPGGMALNLKVGDSVFGWAVDHAAPCVSIVSSRSQSPLPLLACLGNEARILSGEAKGTRGIITGISKAHGQVFIDFPDSIFEHISLEDTIQIRAFGQGLRLVDYEQVVLGGVSPELLDKMKIEEDVQEHQLRIPVTAKISAQALVSASQQTLGLNLDLNLQYTDLEQIKEFQLEHLRLGDVVAIVDHPTRYQGRLQQEMVSIAIVTYTASSESDLGPGIQTIMTGTPEALSPFLHEDSNLGRYLNLGRYRV